MADYYQLIARAVNTLPNNSPETRDAIYERARRALVKQLRVLEPPVSEEDIERETKSLEEAIAQLEFETALASPADLGKKPKEPQTSALTSSNETKPEAPAMDTSIPHENEPPPFTTEIAKIKSGEAWLNPPSPPEQPGPPAPEPAPDLQAMEDPAEEAKPKETARPVAPSVEENKKSSTRILILAAVAGLVIASVAGTALWLKQNPDDPARKPRIDGVANTETRPAQGKISERADAPPPPPITNITPAKSASAEPTAPNADKPVLNIPSVPRSALLIEAPEEPSRIKTYVGTVTWSTNSKTSSSGTITVMHGDVVIEDADLKFSFNLQKNDDPNFPADLLMDLRFNTGAQSKVKAVKDMNMPEMRQQDTAQGEPLKGGVVAITPTVYLAGLSRVDREKTRNSELLIQRGWFDLPMTLGDGRAAKLTIEKGQSGENALSEALK